MSSTKLRDVIFSLHTRKFGNVGEIIIEEFLKMSGYVVSKSDCLSYDRKVNDTKDEFKCSRVWTKSVLELGKKNIVESLLNHDLGRKINFDEREDVEWNCNIQQIKSDLFSTLWYALFFNDKIVIFKIDSDQIKMQEGLNYSDKQHRGNEGEGQFHISNKNINFHMENFSVGTFSYEEIYQKFNN